MTSNAAGRTLFPDLEVTNPTTGQESLLVFDFDVPSGIAHAECGIFFFSEIGRELQPGDEIIVTRLDHDANIAPWLALEEKGVVVRHADFNPDDCTLDMEGLERLINERTRLVAVGYASNAVGTINDVRRIAALAHSAGAWIYVDAVHYAPHGPIDVQALDCDLVVSSV